MFVVVVLLLLVLFCFVVLFLLVMLVLLASLSFSSLLSFSSSRPRPLLVLVTSSSSSLSYSVILFLIRLPRYGTQVVVLLFFCAWGHDRLHRLFFLLFFPAGRCCFFSCLWPRQATEVDCSFFAVLPQVDCSFVFFVGGAVFLAGSRRPWQEAAAQDDCCLLFFFLLWPRKAAPVDCCCCVCLCVCVFCVCLRPRAQVDCCFSLLAERLLFSLLDSPPHSQVDCCFFFSLQTTGCKG